MIYHYWECEEIRRLSLCLDKHFISTQCARQRHCLHMVWWLQASVHRLDTHLTVRKSASFVRSLLLIVFPGLLKVVLLVTLAMPMAGFVLPFTIIQVCLWIMDSVLRICAPKRVCCWPLKEVIDLFGSPTSGRLCSLVKVLPFFLICELPRYQISVGSFIWRSLSQNRYLKAAVCNYDAQVIPLTKT